MLAQTLPMEEEPLDSRVSETRRIAYGNSSSEGITGREVVMVDIAFVQLNAKAVKGLCFAERCQCQYVQNLGLAAGKQCAAVRAGK